MALRLLKPGEGARLLGYIFWMEDLERAGKTYGDLLGYLDDLHIPCVCSPIHNRDKYTAEDVQGWNKRHIDPDTGELATEYTNQTPQVDASKKDHVHTYYKFKGQRKPVWLAELFNDFVPGLVSPKRFVLVPDWGAIVRYCAHMDQPNKAQYDSMAIHGFANVDMSALNDTTNVDKLAVTVEIEQAIRENKITSYYQLNRWANSTGDREIMSMVKGRTSHWVPIFRDIKAEKYAKEQREKEEREKAKAIQDVKRCAESVKTCAGNMEELIG